MPGFCYGLAEIAAAASVGVISVRQVEAAATDWAHGAGRQPRMNADERGERGQRSLLRQELSRRVIGAYYDVYGELGYGFVESVYQEAFAIALTDRGASVSREPAILVSFRGRSAGLFRPDFIVDNAIVVELKAVRALEPAHEAQLLNYLRACDVELGLLLNFGPKAEFRRFVWRNSRKLRVSPRSSAVD